MDLINSFFFARDKKSFNDFKNREIEIKLFEVLSFLFKERDNADPVDDSGDINDVYNVDNTKNIDNVDYIDNTYILDDTDAENKNFECKNAYLLVDPKIGLIYSTKNLFDMFRFRRKVRYLYFLFFCLLSSNQERQ